MASKHLFPITTGLHTPPLLLVLLPLVLLLVTARCAVAQPPPLSDNNNKNSYPNTNFNPSMAIVIVVLISAFFFLGFLSIYIRQCAGDRLDPRVSVRGGGAARSRRQRGLDPEVLETFPTLVYSEVKGLKIGKGTLECAVCLSEFEDEETLRFLPKCSHVFHPDCIDAWLASHVTCPLCRSNLVPDPNAPEVEITDPPIPLAAGETTDQGPMETPQEVEAPPDHVAITVEDEDRKAEMIDLDRIARMKRARSKARPARFPRSHSTGHSLIQPGENLDRFTLRLPENIRKEIVAAVMLQRTKSCVAFPAAGEGSSRRGYREEGSSRAGRSIRLGRSDRWPSVLLRTFSARVPGWAMGRRGDPEGSTKAGRRIEPDGSVKGESSTKGKLTSAVRAPLDWLGGGGAKFNVGADENESSTAAFARV